MWTAILTFLGGPVIKGLIDGYKAKLEAGNTADKIAADLAGKDLELQAKERELNVRQNIADEGRWWTAAPRAIICWSMSLFIAKVVVIDTVLGWGVTPALKGQVADAFSAVIVMYFGGRTVEKVARIWRSR
jgi:NAD(P)H-hydrate repair Nnr-like enzyme with NAD(P)H-hydrate epimerase domain